MKLTNVDVAPATARLIEQVGLRAFTREHAIARGALWPRCVKLYDRALMPAGVAVLGVLQLAHVIRIVFG